ncbi:MAG: hypothetical protein ABJA02_07540 [Acidobacteriota bacterium]
MIERNYDRQKLNDYLLGSLPEAESEDFDELSVTDDDFVDSLNAAENDLVDAYANGELTGSTLARFEGHYLASPLRREKMIFARSLHTFGGEKEVNLVAAPQAAEERSAVSWFNPMNLGFAFVAMLIVFGAALWFVNKRSDSSANEVIAKQASPNPYSGAAVPHSDKLNDDQNTTNGNKPVFGSNGVQPSPTPAVDTTPKLKLDNSTTERPVTGPAVFSFILNPPLRGAGRLPTVAIPKSTTEVSAQLRLESNDSELYSVSLTDESGAVTLWSSGRLKSRVGSKSITIRFPAKLLQSQIYNLTVSGIDATGKAEVIGVYPFRVFQR